MKKNLKSRGHRFGFEHLEAKRLLAGDVTVTYVANVLTLTGDTLDNDVLIQDTATGFSITGRNGTDLRFNGQDQAFLNFSNAPLLSINATMDQGDDIVEIVDVDVTGAAGVTVTGGEDDDRVILDGVDSAGDVTVNGNSGSDTVQILGSANRDYLSLTVNTGTENDRLHIFNQEITNNLTVDTASGNDVVEMINVDVNGGAGNSTVTLGAGNDFLEIENSRIVDGAAFTINGDEGNDRVNMFAGTDIEGDLTVLLGEGENVLASRQTIGTTGSFGGAVTRTNATFGLDVQGDTQVTGLSGNDRIVLQDAIFGETMNTLTIDTNEGADLVSLSSSGSGATIGRQTVVNGVVTINTLSGADSVAIRRAIVEDVGQTGDIVVNLGTENDQLILQTVDADAVNADGMTGQRDRLRQSGNTFGIQNFMNFEEFGAA